LWICRLLHPQMAVLITSVSSEGKYNVMTAAWCTPVSFRPPLVAVSISPLRYTHELISETGEFAVNIPSIDLIDAVKYCGSVSGRDVDKFKETGLTPIKGREIKAPIIAECVAALECKVVKSVEAGDHTLFIGEVVSFQVREGFFKDTYTKNFKPILHLGGDRYHTIGEKVVKYDSSSRRRI